MKPAIRHRHFLARPALILPPVARALLRDYRRRRPFAIDPVGSGGAGGAG